jgi:hypothetical protein
MLADSTETEGDPRPLPPAQVHKLGSLAAGVSGEHAAKPPTVVHHDTIRNPQRHLTPEQWAARQVSPAEFRAWKKVNICEESGDWHVRGETYSGGLGISNYNWDYYRPDSFPANAADATPAEQIVVAERIQPNPPDQHGCESGGW